MKPQLSQQELRELVNENRISIWAYKTLYEIDQYKNGKLYLRKVLTATISTRYPFKSVTRAGRFHAMRPELAQTYLDYAENGIPGE